MKRHLRAMQDIASRNDGEAYWRPTGSEWSTAQALAKRGLLRRDFSDMSGGQCFQLTGKGFDE